MKRDLCPHCGQEIPDGASYLTDRELDVLTSWWMLGSVKEAAADAGVGEQRAKNLLARARIRNGASSNGELLTQHFARVRSKAMERMQHNIRRTAA